MTVPTIAPVVTPPVATEPVVPAAVVTPPAVAAPPWGTPEEFDPEKAWALIQNLKAQKNDPAVAKELADLRAAKQASEDAALSATEKERVRADRAETALAESTASSLRSAIALEKGLTASQAKRLVGTTREELEADAAQLLVDFPVAKAAVAPSAEGQGPVGGPITGKLPQLTKEDVSKLTAEKKFAEIEAARVEGRLDDLLSGKTPI